MLPLSSLVAFVGIFQYLASALPQGEVGTTAGCVPTSTTIYRIDASITPYTPWRSSMNAKYSTPGVVWSGYSVAYFSTVLIIGTRTSIITQWYDSNAITSEGYNILTEVVPTTSCPITTTTTSTSPTLPPSPTTANCSPHIDHWHCEPWPTTTDSATTTSPTLPPSPTTANCSPHDDHWHCEPWPTTTTTTDPVLPPSPTNSICTPHNDHWHCDPLPTTTGSDDPGTTDDCEPEPTNSPCDDCEPVPTPLPTGPGGPNPSDVPQPVEPPPGSGSGSGSGSNPPPADGTDSPSPTDLVTAGAGRTVSQGVSLVLAAGIASLLLSSGVASS